VLQYLVITTVVNHVTQEKVNIILLINYKELYLKTLSDFI